jgi:hypothetical protein
VSIKLAAQIELMPGVPEMHDGWRGLLDFGEKWTKEDADLAAPGPIPIGEPLMYGCEVHCDANDHQRVTIGLWALDDPRKVMEQGAAFVLRDGLTARASGTLL